MWDDGAGEGELCLGHRGDGQAGPQGLLLQPLLPTRPCSALCCLPTPSPPSLQPTDHSWALPHATSRPMQMLVPNAASQSQFARCCLWPEGHGRRAGLQGHLHLISQQREARWLPTPSASDLTQQEPEPGPGQARGFGTEGLLGQGGMCQGELVLGRARTGPRCMEHLWPRRCHQWLS